MSSWRGAQASGFHARHTDGAGGFFGPRLISAAMSRGDNLRPIRFGGAASIRVATDSAPGW
jgi:hypothetical protein